MTTQVVLHPRSEPVSEAITKTLNAPVITVKASQRPESQVKTIQANQETQDTTTSNPRMSIITIACVSESPVTTVSVIPAVASHHCKPVQMSKVLAISAPIPESSMKIINDFHDDESTSLEDVLHLVESSNLLQEAARKESESEAAASSVFKCDICDYSSNNKHYLKQHVDLVHNAGRPYKCPYCDYAGKRNHSLREHLVVHSNERPYECNHCNATFRKKGHLTNHVKLHASPKVIKCSLCTSSVVLPDQGSYMEHLKSVHNTNKLFACDMCEFITGTEESIKSHMIQYHSDSKLYQCGMCSFVTKDLNLIGSHIESHSKPKGCSPEKVSTQPTLITKLTESSTPTAYHTNQTPVFIKCSECGYTASDRENMKSHMIQHIQNKTSEINVPKPKVIQPTLPQKASYKCTDCSFISTEATSFIHHMLIHKTIAKEQKVDVQTLYNIKPVSKENTCKISNAPFYHDERTGRFICTICGYGCEYQRTIKSHIWKHSGNKDIVYPMFQNGPLSVYEENVNRAQAEIPKTKLEEFSTDTPSTSFAPGTTICKIKISEDKMIAYMKEVVRHPIKLHEFSKLENKKPVFTNSVLKADPQELAVVVEAIKGIPSTHGFTGMNSQHNSPKRPLSPASTEDQECKRQKVKDKIENRAEEIDSKETSPNPLQSFKHDNKTPPSDKEPTESALALLSLQKDQESNTVNAPFYNTRSRGTVKKRKIHGEEVLQAINPAEAVETQPISQLKTKSGDATAAGGAAGGICSSLLAVIEQLRERSKFEVDTENYSKAAGRRTATRRRSRHDSSDDDLPNEFADSIEKISEEGEFRYRCKFCHYSNSKPLLIRIHMRLHKSKKPFECSLCDFVARSIEGLQVHMIQHCKVRTYQCKLCPSAFNYKSQLRAHMRAHTDKDTYICDFCDFVTSNLTAYRQHTLIHSDTATYSCSNCHKKYTSQNSLLRHVCIMSHGDSVDEDLELSSDDETSLAAKELKCPDCDFNTIDISELTTHSATHVHEMTIPIPLKCEMCDFTAVSNRSLKSHMKRHINDQRYVQQPLEQYKCNLCGYVCHHLPSLKSHMWRHASDRNYSYEFTNDVINAAIDFDIRVDGKDANDPEILERVLSSERKIVEGRLNNTEQPGGKMPVCWVTFRCCQCGFETINKPELNVHMRSHSDIIQKTLEVSHPSGSLIEETDYSESHTEDTST